MTTASQVVNTAISEVGYTECPRSATGRCLFTGHSGAGANHTKFAEQAGLQNGVYWCAVFTTAILKRNGVTLPPGTGTASTRANLAAWKKAGKWVQPADIQAGDVVFFHTSNRNGSDHNIPSHTGIATGRPSNGRLPSVEGNTSSDNAGDQENGGGVFTKSRPLSVVIGAGRPSYDGAAQPTPTRPQEDIVTHFYKIRDEEAAGRGEYKPAASPKGDAIWVTVDSVHTNAVSYPAWVHMKGLGWWDESHIDLIPEDLHNWFVQNNKDQNEG